VSRADDLLQPDAIGLACADGGFHIDPWGPATTAVITHAHADHARAGSARYVCSASCAPLLAARLPAGASITGVPFGEPFTLGSVRVSFHPAGHILGAAQVRVEGRAGVWVASGDYKRQPDPTAEAFEIVPCDVFISEATFALPIYRWKPGPQVASEILDWWTANSAKGRTSVLFTYALGKAQRALAELARLPGFAAALQAGGGAVCTHGAVEPLVDLYRRAGVALPPTVPVSSLEKGAPTAGRLAIAPPSAAGSTWMRRFGPPASVDTGFASGWMLVRGIRRRRGYDRGFVLSDHADFDDLLRTVRECGCRRVLSTHGYSATLAACVRDLGLEADVLRTPYATQEEE
jgi:putative mRNA 3-end processing factor